MMPYATPDDGFQLSATDQQVLNDMAAHLEQEDPALAATLGGEESPKMSRRAKLGIALGVVVLLLAMLSIMAHEVLHGGGSDLDVQPLQLTSTTDGPYAELNPNGK
jgi:hypothetical protein